MINRNKILAVIIFCIFTNYSNIVVAELQKDDRAFVVRTALYILRYIGKDEVNDFDYSGKGDSIDVGLYELSGEFWEPVQRKFTVNSQWSSFEKMRYADGSLTSLSEEVFRYLFDNFHLEKYFSELLRPVNTKDEEQKNKRMIKALLYLVGYDVPIDNRLTSGDLIHIKNYMERVVKFPDTTRLIRGNVSPNLKYIGLKKQLYYMPEDYSGRMVEFEQEYFNEGKYEIILNGYREDRVELAALLHSIKPDEDL